MDLATYLTQHDGAVDRNGRELRRLAKAAGASVSHTYVCALGHKTPSRKLALKYQQHSKQRAIDAAMVLGLKGSGGRRKVARG
jgi:hypothetical protein